MKTICYMTSVCVLGIGLLVGEHNLFAAGFKETLGEPVPLGNGIVQTFVRQNDQGIPTEIGVYFSKDSLSNLPGGISPIEVMLKLPHEISVPPYNHIGIDWNSHGHDPMGIYDAAHFDVHFYFVPMEERDKIAPDANEQFAKAPPAETLPAEYQSAPSGVPRMGANWVDVTSPEFAGVPFTATFIYGTYDGEVTFYEPMVAKAFMDAAPDFIADVKQPLHYSREGYYPMSYRVIYDAGVDRYLVTLDDLRYRKL